MNFNIKGLQAIETFFHEDNRGSFQKPFNRKIFDDLGIIFDINESYISISKRGSLRGMHYQKKPFGHDKLVSCIQGKALDVCVDLREDSGSFGRVDSMIIEPGSRSVFIPEGVAHGFYAFEDNTSLVYFTSSIYNPNFDSGILWSSIDFEWPDNKPYISERDIHHPNLKELKND